MKNLARILRFHMPGKAAMALGIGLAFTAALSGLGLLALSGWFIAAMGLAGAAGAAMNYFTPAAIIRAFAMMRTAGRYAERLVNHDAALKNSAAFRPWFFGRLIPLSPSGLQDVHSGALFDRLRGDIDRLEAFYLNAFVPLAVSVPLLAGSLLLWGIYSRPLAAIEACLLVSCAAVPPFALRKRRHSAQAEIDRVRRDMRVLLSETAQSAPELAVYPGDPGPEKAADDLAQRLAAAQKRIARQDRFNASLLTLAAGAGLVAAIAALSPLIAAGAVSPPILAMGILLCLGAFEAASSVPRSLLSLRGAEDASARILAISDRVPPRHGADPVPPGPFDLELRRLTFAYGGTPAVRDVSFVLKAGETIFVTGPSGAGKSTILHLLAGFLTPGQDMILLNGCDIADCDPESLRAAFSWAPQKPYLFAGTIRSNLTLAAPDATETEIVAACAAACLAETIAALPMGYDTYIGENGVRLSGGQIRRLSIARALLKPACCLLLDEPGEGLDAGTKHDLMKNVRLRARERNMALLICAHEAADMQDGDREVALAP